MSDVNLSSITPVAAGGYNIRWQSDVGPDGLARVSAYLLNSDIAQQGTFPNPKDGVNFAEDFLNGLGTSGELGAMKWGRTLINGSAPNSEGFGTSAGCYGVYSAGWNAFTSGNLALYLPLTHTGIIAYGSHVFDSWWRVSVSTTAGPSMQFGFWDSIASNAPSSNGIWIGGAGTGPDFHCKSGGSTTSSTQSWPNTGFNNYRIRSVTPGTILFSINGGAETSISTNVPTAKLFPVWQPGSGGGSIGSSFSVDLIWHSVTLTR